MLTPARGTVVTSRFAHREAQVGRVVGHALDEARSPVVVWMDQYGDTCRQVEKHDDLIPVVTLPVEALDAAPGEYVDGGRNHFLVKAPADRAGTRDAVGVDLGGVYEFNGVGLSKDAAMHVADHLLKFAARS